MPSQSLDSTGLSQDVCFLPLQGLESSIWSLPYLFSPAVSNELTHIFIYPFDFIFCKLPRHIAHFPTSFLLQPVNLKLKYILEISPLIASIKYIFSQHVTHC